MRRLIRVIVPIVFLLIFLASCSLFDKNPENSTAETPDFDLNITQISTILPATASATNTAASLPTHTETIKPSQTSTFTLAPSATSTRSPTPTQKIATSDIKTPLSTIALVPYVGDLKFSGSFDKVKIKFWISSDGKQLTNLSFTFLNGFKCNEEKILFFEGVESMSTGVDIEIAVKNGVFFKENHFMEFEGIITDNEAEGEIYLVLNALLPNYVLKGNVCTFGPVEWTAKAR